VDQQFPEALKEPVLRKIQFSTNSRLDHLVEYIYEATPHILCMLTCSNSGVIIIQGKP